MIAEGASLTDVLEDLCAAIDAQSPEIMSTIMQNMMAGFARRR
jgi:hypothetical protein